LARIHEFAESKGVILKPERNFRLMSDERFDIPQECRSFDQENLVKRREVAKGFVTAFVEKAAPPLILDDPNGQWTNSIRTRLRDICPADCDYLPENPCSSKGEFLVDSTWEEKKRGHRILLAVESEWGTDRYGENPQWRPVEADFEKLLVIKAPFKLLIFSSNCKLGELEGIPDGDFPIEFAKKRIETSLEGYGHHLAGEVYIFVDFPRNSNTRHGTSRSFVWQAKKCGEDNDVAIEHLLKGGLNPR
jgi:hypothetical protein